MSNKCYACVLTVISILVFSGVMIKRLSDENEALMRKLPYLLPGEKLDYFNLVGMDEKLILPKDLNDGGTSLLFVFKRPCSHCNTNIAIWNRLAKLLRKNGVKVFGIILGKAEEMFELQEKALLNFKLFIPDIEEEFRDNLRLRLNLSYTVIYHNNRVVSIKLGDLKGDDYTQIMRKVKKLLKSSQS